MMIALGLQSETRSPSSPQQHSPKEEAKVLSFADLFQGVVSPKEQSTSQNQGALLLSLDADTATDEESLQLKGNSLLALLQDADFDTDNTSLDTQHIQNLSSDELKSLIADAKQYLKDQILSSEGYKKAEVKELPKTLNGLVDAAKVYGLDLSKISIQTVQADTKDISPQHTTATQGIKLEEEMKTTPLFKAQTQTEHSTEQIVQTKMQRVEQKDPKQKADETLKLLLRGEKASKSDNAGLGVDFSVATAKVIAPSAPKSVESLESLLNADTKSEETPFSQKTDTLSTPKAESFEVKLNEAKQMTKYLSQDVKTAIDDYKSPFTRVKVQLNPQSLGEVDLTIVQRGKNLHINLSSNNSAINALAMNANDLKAQLQNNGINNATLNFSNNSQGGEQAAAGQQQQQHQQREEAKEEYNYFANQEENEEILSSLEIVVPNYA